MFFVVVGGLGGYVILFNVNKSPRFGCLLKPISGLSGKIFCNSFVLSMIFRFCLIILFILGFLVLNFQTINWGLFNFLSFLFPIGHLVYESSSPFVVCL